MFEVIFTTGVDEIKVCGLTQWDRGQQLQITCPDLPSAFQVHYANRRSEEAIVVQAKGADNVSVVTIPDELVREPYELFVYLYFGEGLIGETVKTVRMPVKPRAKPDDYVIDLPQEQVTDAEKVIKKLMDEYVEAEIGAVTSASESAAKAEAAAVLAENAAAEAKAIAETVKDVAADAEAAEAARVAAENAQAAAETARAAAEAAAELAASDVESKLSGYVTDAENARDEAQSAADNAAANVENTLQGYVSAAEQAKTDAQSAAGSAAQDAVAAVDTEMAGYVSAAKAAQAAAEKARDEAQAVAGGDFASTAYVDNKAAAAESNANTYTDEKIAAIPTPDVSGQINTHNTDTSAHSDIRTLANNAASAASTAQSTADTAKTNAATAQSRADAAYSLANGKLGTAGDGSNVTAAFTTASSRANISTGEKLSVIFGKIAKWFADLKTVAFTGSYNDLSDKPTIPSAVTVDSALSSTSTNPVQNKVINSALAGKAPTSHGNHVPTTETANNARFLRNDNTWQAVTPANIGAAASSHGNHVPATETANNAKFLRNDNTWQTVTPANIGAAAASHTHDYAASSHSQAASTITAGTFAGQVVANSSGQTPGTSLLRNSKIVSAEETPTVNGEIYWVYGAVGGTKEDISETPES